MQPNNLIILFTPVFIALVNYGSSAPVLSSDVYLSLGKQNKEALAQPTRFRRAFDCYLGLCKRPASTEPLVKPFSPSENEIDNAENRKNMAKDEAMDPISAECSEEDGKEDGWKKSVKGKTDMRLESDAEETAPDVIPDGGSTDKYDNELIEDPLVQETIAERSDSGSDSEVTTNASDNGSEATTEGPDDGSEPEVTTDASDDGSEASTEGTDSGSEATTEGSDAESEANNEASESKPEEATDEPSLEDIGKKGKEDWDSIFLDLVA